MTELEQLIKPLSAQEDSQILLLIKKRSLPWAGGLNASLSQEIPNRGARILLVSEAVHMGILAFSIGHAGSKRASSH